MTWGQYKSCELSQGTLACLGHEGCAGDAFGDAACAAHLPAAACAPAGAPLLAAQVTGSVAAADACVGASAPAAAVELHLSLFRPARPRHHPHGARPRWTRCQNRCILPAGITESKAFTSLQSSFSTEELSRSVIVLRRLI